MTANPRCHESFEVTSPRAGTNAEPTTRFEQAMLLTKQTHWPPGFVDYLFIAFTQSSTFGPTDAPLLARWAKLLTVVQISISLSIVILLIARAVGVL